MSTQIHDVDQLIQERIRAATPDQCLYNPSNERIEAMVGGLIYSLPPEGVLNVKDQMGVSKEERKLAKSQKRKPRADAIVVSSLQVVRHLLRKLSNRGVVFLYNDERDEALKAEAHETWARFQVAQSEQIIAAYNNRTRAFHGDPRNAGKFAPTMSDREIAAQEVIDSYQAGRIGKFKFLCPHRDGYGTNDQAKMETHMLVAHPATVADETQPVIPQKRRGRPPKARAEA